MFQLILQICATYYSDRSLTVIVCNFMQYDAFDIGFITTDDFTNADILEATYPAIAKRLHDDWLSDPAIPIITGFLGKVLFSFDFICLLHLMDVRSGLRIDFLFGILSCRVGELLQ